MTWDRKLVRFWDDSAPSLLFRYSPWTAAATLPAAIIEGGLAMNLTSTVKAKERDGKYLCPKAKHLKQITD